MSHVDLVECDIQDLQALGVAGGNLKMELIPQSTFRWYGTHVGDYPLPPGFTKEDMGKCEYVLRIKDNSTAYEIGIVKRRDGKPGYIMLYDFWAGGKGLEEVVGKKAAKLRREYALEVGMKAMRKKGFKVSREMNQETGKPRMRARRG